MGRDPKRYLILPDREVDAADILTCAATSDASVQQYGPSVRQPTPGTPRAVGDISPTLSGVPDDHEAGALCLSLAGPVERARFGWLRDGDDPDDDLQMRQSPMVCGRRPAMLINTSGVYVNRPRLLPLRSGNLMLVYLQSTKPQNRQHETSGGAPACHVYFPGDNYWKIYDHGTTAWVEDTGVISPVMSSIGGSDGPGTAGSDLATPCRVGLDVVQFPDTGEVLAFLAVQDSNLTQSTRRIYTYHSTDDGATWYERSRAFGEGTYPDFLLYKSTALGVVTLDTTPIQDIAAELLDSGRVLLMVRTARSLNALVSDDRGVTWTATRVGTDVSNIVAPDFMVGNCVSVGKMRNGRVIVFETATVNGAAPYPRAWVTSDGTRFSSAIDLPEYNGFRHGFFGHGVCMRPDGWPAIYGALHFYQNAVGSGSRVFVDWLAHVSLRTRDPGMNDTAADWFGVPGLRTFHGIVSSASAGPGGTADTDVEWKTDGFASVDAVNYRGQVVLAASYVRETGSDAAAPTLAESSLMIYRLNHWQPLQERLGEADATWSGDADPPMAARVYNATWDCYTLPSNAGLTSSGGGTATLVDGTVEDGYLALATAVTTRYYGTTTLPHPNLDRSAAFRFVVQAKVGGSLDTSDIAFLLRLYKAAVPEIGELGGSAVLVIRLKRGATHTEVALIDGVADDQIGTAVSVPNDQWIEVIGAMVELSANTVRGLAYVRSDPGGADWDEPYTLIATDTLETEAVLLEGINFGNIASATATSWWKTVQIHRPESGFPSTIPLAQRGTDHTDDATSHDFQDTGGQGVSANDHGIANIMRTSQATAIPRQYLTGGVSVAWRGEAKVEGVYDYATGYDYPAESMLAEPVQREWRSAETGKAVEVIFDAGADRRFRPTAAALIGRNFPACTLQMHTSNTSAGWAGSTAVRVRWGWAGGGDTVDRYTHLWAWQSQAGWSYAVSSGRVTVFAPSDAQPWRPHQFRSQATGPRFYWVVNHGGSNSSVGTWRAYRIRDNTGDTLTLETVPSISDVALVLETGASFTYPWAIYADRFAALIDHEVDNNTQIIGLVTMPNAHALGFRYMRLLIPAVTMMDADETFARLGRLVLGRAFELSTPGPQWGWSVSQESGTDLTETATGATYGRRRHSPRRVWSFDYGYLLPANEAEAVLRSPASQPTRRPWQGWLDAVRALEIDGRAAALVWEGDRADGSLTEDVVQVAADPSDVMMVRLTAAGTVEQTGYTDRELNLAAGTTCVPRPVCIVRGITLREEF